MVKGEKKGVGENGRAEAPPLLPYLLRHNVLTLHVRVQPGAGRSEWAGLHGPSAIRLRLMAPAVEGKANKACLRFVAKAAKVPHTSVSIVRGEKSRDKVIRIQPFNESRLEALIATWTL